MTKPQDRSQLNPSQNSPQSDSQSNLQKNTFKLDPATTVLVILALLFIPLVLTGLFSQ